MGREIRENLDLAKNFLLYGIEDSLVWNVDMYVHNGRPFGYVWTRIQDLMEEHEIKITELKEQLQAIEQQKMVFQYFT